MAQPDRIDENVKLIAITGPTGVGKTAFINNVCGSQLPVGTSLQSCTTKVQTASCNINGVAVTLIDTPGFDDTDKSQAEILKDIADFLEQTYQKGKKLTGVIYMHRISDYRVGGISRENFRLFTKICGRNAMENTLIATTMWKDVTEEIGRQRETELQENATLFKEAVDHGARMCRLYDTSISAMETMRLLLDYQPKSLQMQHELVDEHKKLQQTDAGTELHRELDRQAMKHRSDMQQKQREMEKVLSRKEASCRAAMDEIKEALNDLQAQLNRLEIEVKKLQDDLADQKRKRPQLGLRERIFARFRRGQWGKNPDAIAVEKLREGSGCLDDTGFEL